MRSTVVALVFMATVFAGCSDDSSDTSDTSDTSDADGVSAEPASPPTAGPVCELATAEEVSAIVGNEVIAVDLDPTLCEYSLVDGAPGNDGTTVDLFVSPSEETCELQFGLVGAESGQPVDGLGNAAYWKAGSPTAQLHVCTGSSFLTITQYKPSTVTDDMALARAKELSNVVLSRL